MRKLILTLATVLTLTSVRADLVIYKQKLKVTKTGAGTVQKITITGGVITDVNANEWRIIKVYDDRKRFSIENPVHDLEYVPAGNKDYLVLAVAGNGIGGLTGKATTKETDIGSNTFTSYNIGLKFKVTGSDLFSSGGEQWLQEYKGVWAYDKKATATANFNNMTLDDALQTVRDGLTSEGYTEE